MDNTYTMQNVQNYINGLEKKKLSTTKKTTTKVDNNKVKEADAKIAETNKKFAGTTSLSGISNEDLKKATQENINNLSTKNNILQQQKEKKQADETKVYHKDVAKNFDNVTKKYNGDFSSLYDSSGNNFYDYETEQKNALKEQSDIVNLMNKGNLSNDELKKYTQRNIELTNIIQDTKDKIKDQDAIRKYNESLYIQNEATDEEKKKFNESASLASNSEDTVGEKVGKYLGRKGSALQATTAGLMNEIPQLATNIEYYANKAMADKTEDMAEAGLERGIIDEEQYNALMQKATEARAKNILQNEESISYKLNELATQYNQNAYFGAGKIESLMTQAEQSQVQFLVHFALGKAVASIASGASAISEINETAGKISNATMALSGATGRTFELLTATDENGNRLYTDEQALGNGLMTGTVSYFVEKVGMDKFVETLTGGDTFVKILTDRANYILKNTGKQFLSEGMEEVVEGLIDPAIDWATGVNDTYEVDGSELLTSFIVGGLAGAGSGLVASHSFVINTHQQYNIAKSELAKAVDIRKNAVKENDYKAVKNCDIAIDKLTSAIGVYEANSKSLGVEFANEQIINSTLDEDTQLLYDSYTPDFNQEVQNYRELNQAYTTVMNNVSEYLSTYGINTNVEDFVDADQETRNNVLKTSQWANAKGAPVEFKKEVLDVNGKPVNAKYNTKTNNIDISYNADKGMVSALIHEYTHFAEKGKSYNILKTLTTEQMGTEQFNKAVSDLMSRDNMTKANAEAEIVAQQIENLLGNESFANKLARYNDSLAYRILQDVKNIVKIGGEVGDIEYNLMKAIQEAKNVQSQEDIDKYSIGGKNGIENLRKALESNPSLGSQLVDYKGKQIKLEDFYYNVVNDFAKAKKLESQNLTDAEIHKQTGWWMGRDVEERLEFYDDGSVEKLKNYVITTDNDRGTRKNENWNRIDKSKDQKLSDILPENSLLFLMYPQLKDAYFAVWNRSGGKETAYALLKDNNSLLTEESIRVRKFNRNGEVAYNTLSGSIAHELQHFIQEYENFDYDNGNKVYNKQLRGVVPREEEASRVKSTTINKDSRYTEAVVNSNFDEVNKNTNDELITNSEIKNKLVQYYGASGSDTLANKLIDSVNKIVDETSLDASQTSNKLIETINENLVSLGVYSGYGFEGISYKNIVEDLSSRLDKKFSNNLSQETKNSVIDELTKIYGFSKKIDDIITTYGTNTNKGIESTEKNNQEGGETVSQDGGEAGNKGEGNSEDGEVDKQSSNVIENGAKVIENPEQVQEDAEERAKVLVDNPKKVSKASLRQLLDKAKYYLSDFGVYVDNFAKRVNNEEISNKYDYMLSSNGIADSALVRGHYGKDGRLMDDGISKVFEGLEGQTKEDFFNYLYHYRNLDEMTLNERKPGKLQSEIAKNAQDILSNKYGIATNEEGTHYIVTKNEEGKNIISELSQEVYDEYAKRSLEEAKATTTINKPVFGKDVSANESQKAINEYESKHPEFKDKAKKIWQYERNELLLQQEYGLASQHEVELMMQTSPHYVPIFRNVESQKSKAGSMNANKALMNFEGSNTDILPLDENIVNRTRQVYRAITQNDLFNEMFKSIGAEATPSGNYNLTDEAIDKLGLTVDAGKRYITFYKDGQGIKMEIGSDLYDSLKTHKTYRAPILSDIADFRRNIITGWNPIFWVTNGMKDIQDVPYNTKFSAPEYTKAYLEAWNQIKTNGDLYTLYLANGGGQNSFTKLGETSKMPKELSGLLGFGEQIETAPRLAEFIATINKGGSIQQAMRNSAEVTTNFKRGGTVSKTLNANGATFLNASIVGFQKQINNYTNAYEKHGVVGVASYMAKMVLLYNVPLMLANYLRWKDDDDYAQLSDYVKENYYMLWKNDDGTFVRLPKGRLNAFYQTVIQSGVDTVTGKKTLWEALLKDWESFKTNIAPNSLSESSIFAPFQQAFLNGKAGKTWYGTDIVPTRLQNVPEAEQFDSSTDSLSKWIGEKINVSPMKINYFLDQSTGMAGDFVLPALTLDAENGIDNKVLSSLASPLLDKFTTNSVLKNQYVTDFYTMTEELEKNAKSSKATDEDVLAYRYMSTVTSQMGELYKQKREIQADTTLSNKEKYNKVLEVQTQIDALAKYGLENYDQLDVADNYATVGGVQYYKNGDTWKKLTESQLKKIDGLNLTTQEKSEFYNLYNSIGDAREEIKANTPSGQEADYREATIGAIQKSNLSDDAKNNMYDSYYGGKFTEYVNDMDLDSATKLEMKYANSLLEADYDSNGKAISNSKAEKVKARYIELGVYDKVLEYIKKNNLSYSAFGLTKSVVSGSTTSSNESSFAKAYSKALQELNSSNTSNTISVPKTTSSEANNGLYNKEEFAKAYSKALSSKLSSSNATSCPNCHNTVVPINGRCPVCSSKI